MGRKKCVLILLALYVLSIDSFCQGKAEAPKPGVIVETNLAYWALSAISHSESNLLAIIPLYSQICLSDDLSLDASVVYIFNRNSKTANSGSMLLTEIGMSFHPFGNGLPGWTMGILPGILYSFDSNIVGLAISANAGYQWIIDERIVVGALIGGRYIYVGGTLALPDLAINVGWRFGEN